MKNITFDTTIDADPGIPRETAVALAMVAHVKGLVECFQELGLTKEQAMERMPNAIASAWEPLQ